MKYDSGSYWTSARLVQNLLKEELLTCADKWLNICCCIIIVFMFCIFSSAYGSLTVRSLLDTSSQCLAEFDFPDPYSQVRNAGVVFTL